MATLSNLYKSGKEGLDQNFGVDYVILFEYSEKDRDEAEAAYVQLVKELTNIGLAAEVRPGEGPSLLVFVKAASDKHLNSHIYRARLQDWLHGVRPDAPDKNVSRHFEREPVSEAERLRLIYLLITKPKNEGGAGISPQSGTWKHVRSVFPLHDHSFNRAWIKEWGTKYVLDDADITKIRDKFGEKVGLYFAFLQAYFKFLVLPAAYGFGAWLLLGSFSWFYAIVNSLWSVVFFEYWKHKEADLAVEWGVKGVSRIQYQRPQFEADREAQDPVTGEVVKVYSPMRRLQTQLLQIPFAMACAVVLGCLISLAYSIEIFISEVYTGPGKSVMVFAPTVVLTLGVPTLSAMLTKVARKLTDLENYETHDTYHAALVQKVFFINFVTSYGALLITSFVYLPFGHILVPWLDVFNLTKKHLGEDGFQINPGRLSKQLFYFTVTAQVVNFAMETLVPYAKRRAMDKIKGGEKQETKDHPEEAAFLRRVRDEAKLEKYDPTDDLREMVVQFGYLALFSVVWPLVGCSFLVNNWVEARSDAMKIAIGSQRPIPWRGDSIGPWINSLGFLSWFGSLTTAALVYLYGGNSSSAGDPSKVTGWALLLSILLSEHLYLGVQAVVRYALEKMDSPGLQKERAVRFRLRKNLLDESLGAETVGVDGSEPSGLGLEKGEKITRGALEDAARRASTQGHGGPEDIFWQRQQGMMETIDIGRKQIAKVGLRSAIPT